MILRRITEHVKAQNWTAVAIDFVIVVVGILIAFQITAWGENWKDIREEQELKARLKVEFTALEGLLDRRIARAQGLVDSTGRLIELIRVRATPRDEIAVREMLRNALHYNAPIAPPTTYSEALASGRIGKIRDVRLRRVLNEYQISTQWWGTVSGASPIQNDPNSHLLQGITMSADRQSWEDAQYRVLSFDWARVRQAERELGVIQRLQSFQTEAYRLERVAVRNVLLSLKGKP